MIPRGCGSDLAATIVKFLAEQHRSIKFRVFPKMLSGHDISELDLSQRAYNCLKRSGFETAGQLADSIAGVSDLQSIRNMGVKSSQEVMFRLFLFQASLLEEERRDQYFKEVIELNHLEGEIRPQ